MPQSFPAELRIANDVATISGADDSLESINTAKLAHRSVVMVAENNSMYMLRKEATDAPSGTDIVAPVAGPGRWFKYPISSGGGDPVVGVATMAAINALLFPTGTLTTLQPGAVQEPGLLYAGSPTMSLDDDKLVFSVTGDYLVTCFLQVNAGSQTVDQGFYGAIDLNGDLVGHDLIDAVPFGGISMSIVKGGAAGTQLEDIIFPMNRLVTISEAGEYVRALFGANAMPSDSLARGFSLSAMKVN